MCTQTPGPGNRSDEEAEDARTGSLNAGVAAAAAAAKDAAAGRVKGGSGSGDGARAGGVLKASTRPTMNLVRLLLLLSYV
jgi:hypothetical protein